MLRALWQRLTGGGGQGGEDGGDPPVGGEETYHGYLILAMPRREGNIYRVAGEIRRSSADGSEARYTFVRVDTDGDYDTVVQLSLRKGRLLVDENGDALFD
ncbi:HlyU family transcriptional regulator [Arhodomonas sp. SL1]|uniref:HlyU family transcriptional regulator n=1 Tax=Arhodomonas sp. SL1 TaxID=3425691 RepID=UPI003F880804